MPGPGGKRGHLPAEQSTARLPASAPRGFAPADFDTDWDCYFDLADEIAAEAEPHEAEPMGTAVEVAAEVEEAPEPSMERRPSADRLLDELRRELRRPNERSPKAKRQDNRGQRCQTEDCLLRSDSSGFCVRHRQTKPTRIMRQTMPDGTCGWGCGRKPRKGTVSCRACAQAKAMVPTCSHEPCRYQSVADGRCGKHAHG